MRLKKTKISILLLICFLFFSVSEARRSSTKRIPSKHQSKITKKAPVREPKVPSEPLTGYMPSPAPHPLTKELLNKKFFPPHKVAMQCLEGLKIPFDLSSNSCLRDKLIKHNYADEIKVPFKDTKPGQPVIYTHRIAKWSRARFLTAEQSPTKEPLFIVESEYNGKKGIIVHTGYKSYFLEADDLWEPNTFGYGDAVKAFYYISFTIDPTKERKTLTGSKPRTITLRLPVRFIFEVYAQKEVETGKQAINRDGTIYQLLSFKPYSDELATRTSRDASFRYHSPSPIDMWSDRPTEKAQPMREFQKVLAEQNMQKRYFELEPQEIKDTKPDEELFGLLAMALSCVGVEPTAEQKREPSYNIKVEYPEINDLYGMSKADQEAKKQEYRKVPPPLTSEEEEKVLRSSCENIRPDLEKGRIAALARLQKLQSEKAAEKLRKTRGLK